MANEVFLSYCRSDYRKVRKIKEEIDREVGISCWMDLDGIESDDLFVNVIIDAIKKHDTFLFMKSAVSMHSKWALDELAFAEREGKRIVLLDLDHSKMTDEFYFRYHSKDVIDWESIQQHDKLLKNLKNWFSSESLLNEQEKNLNARKKNKKTLLPFLLPKLGVIICIVALLAALIALLFNKWGVKEEPMVDTKSIYNEALALCAVDSSEAIVKFIEAAKNDYVPAQEKLGDIYYRGIGTPIDNGKAAKWWRKAAEQGSAYAQANVAEMYHRGTGLTQNDEEAVKWWKMAASQGNAMSQYNLGVCHYYGLGTYVDKKLSKEYFEISANQGFEQSLIALRNLDFD